MITTTKTTKNINARYNMDTGYWAIRDNGQVIAEGQGIIEYSEAVAKVEATATKKVVRTFVEC
jgi:hypothetical protein